MQATAHHPLSIRLAGHDLPLAPRAASAAVIREVRAMPIALQLWLGGLLAVLAVAAVAAVIALPPGWEVFGTTPAFEWGLLIVSYVFFAIMTSGLCLASSLGTVFGIERFRPLEKRHAILALLSLTTAFAIIALDLHYPVRLVFGAMFVPSPTSPMWWMGVTYGAYLVILMVEVWSMFTDHPRIHQAACTAAACTAIVAPATLGAVFAVLVAKPLWYGPFTPVLMVASAFLAGVSLLGIVFYLVQRLNLVGRERAVSLAIPSIRLLLRIGLVVVALLVARQAIAGLMGTERGLRESTEALLFGPLAWQFWGLRVGMGLVVPLLLVFLPMTRTPTGVLVASGLGLIGVFVDRMTFVFAGQIAPYTAVGGTVSYPYATYSPSPVEIAILAGAVAFVALAYTLAERYLDLSESDVHVGFSLPWRRGRRAHPHRPTEAHEPAQAPFPGAGAVDDPTGAPLETRAAGRATNGPVAPPPADPTATQGRAVPS
jgi:Ni/Fe-hydrogenase subunit HybB-like protein